jgi:hypothetical protein
MYLKKSSVCCLADENEVNGCRSVKDGRGNPVIASNEAIY